jgi:hypothetical protein
LEFEFLRFSSNQTGIPVPELTGSVHGISIKNPALITNSNPGNSEIKLHAAKLEIP